jgi:hypothetical protein
MTNTPNDADVNDPATQEVVAKARRFSAVSAGIMLVGVATVIGVIVFRLFTIQGPAVNGQLEAPAGRVIGASAAGDRLTVTSENNGVTTVTVYDLKTLRETHRLVLGGPAVPRR